MKTGIFLCTLFLRSLALPVPDNDIDLSVFFDSPSPTSQGRIVGGAVAAPGAHPWMVAFTRGVSPRTLTCGGSIITKRTVLTAAHCIVPRLDGPNTVFDDVRLVVGTNRYASGGQAYAVDSVAVHPQYDLSVIKNDIGTMFTTEDIRFSDTVTPIALSFDYVGGGVPARIAGWGMTVTTADGSASEDLLELQTSTLTGERCVSDVRQAAITLGRPSWTPVDPRIEICTFHSSGLAACRGDSGSPLVRTDRSQQIGVVSWAFRCALGAPDMYVRVSAYRIWIQENTR